MTDCLFCRIVAGEVPADVVHETERTLAFRDIGPQAPTHVLVVPREHHPDVAAAVDADPTLVAEAMWACLHGVTALLLDLPSQVQAEPDTLIETVLDLAMRGLQEPLPASAPYTPGTVEG